MKTLKLFLEHRTIDEIKIKCSRTNKEITPIYTAYDQESLEDIIAQYKLHKDKFDSLHIYFSKRRGNSWIAYTNKEHKMDISRMNDKFLSSGTIDYSFDDVVSLLNDDQMLIFTN